MVQQAHSKRLGELELESTLCHRRGLGGFWAMKLPAKQERGLETEVLPELLLS